MSSMKQGGWGWVVRCLVREVHHQSTSKHKSVQGGAVEVGSCEQYGGMLKWGGGVGGGVEICGRGRGVVQLDLSCQVKTE